MVLRTYNMPSDVLKGDFCNVGEAIFEGVERPCELIFCILGIQKRDLEELEKLMIQVGEWP
jgi:hypothetical protein